MGKIINGVWTDWIEKVKVLQKAVVVRSDGKLLSLRRSKNEFDGRGGKWDLCGGSLDLKDIEVRKGKSGKGDDEDILIKAIHREIKEETGFSVEKATTKILHSASGFNKKKGVFTVALGYVCRVKENKVELSEEHSDFRWVTKEEFMNLKVGDDGGLIKGILERV